MHTILSSTVVSCDKGVKITRRVEIVCDTEADLPTPEEIDSEGFTVGSISMITDTHEIKILNHAGEWV